MGDDGSNERCLGSCCCDHSYCWRLRRSGCSLTCRSRMRNSLLVLHRSSSSPMRWVKRSGATVASKDPSCSRQIPIFGFVVLAKHTGPCSKRVVVGIQILVLELVFSCQVLQPPWTDRSSWQAQPLGHVFVNPRVRVSSAKIRWWQTTTCLFGPRVDFASEACGY